MLVKTANPKLRNTFLNSLTQAGVSLQVYSSEPKPNSRWTEREKDATRAAERDRVQPERRRAPAEPRPRPRPAPRPRPRTRPVTRPRCVSRAAGAGPAEPAA